MGRYATKNTTSCYRQLDIRDLQRKGFLRPRDWVTLTWSRNGESVGSIGIRSEADYILLRYRHRRFEEDWKDLEYPVFLDTTRCNYGGTRLWFLCPAADCSRRVAILYLGSIFACRHCLKLAYESQREQPHFRALGRARNIIRRLGVPDTDSFPNKPRGMHWRTYNKLAGDYDYYDALSLWGLARRLNLA